MHAAAVASSSSGDASSKKDKKSSKINTDWEELVEEESESRNWKGILIAILVIVTVFSFVIVAIVLVTPDEVVPKKGDKFTLKEILDGAFEPFSIEPHWSPDGNSFMYKSKHNEIISFECKANISTVFLDNSSFRELNTDQYLLSADKSFILFPFQTKMKYKHSLLTRHKIYNTDTRLYRDLIGPLGIDFQHVLWTHSGQGLIAVQGNNIYFKHSFVDESFDFIQITHSGEEGKIYNGVPDWLYGEEVLLSPSTLWLSTDDRFLVYAEINDTDVDEMPTIFYGDPKHKYTEAKRQRYPKSGTTNPTFQIKVYDFRENITRVVQTPKSLIDSDPYFTSVVWRDNTTFLVVWLSRAHNVSLVTVCDATEALCYENLRVEAETGWVDPPSRFVFTPSKNEYFIVLPRKDGGEGFYNNVALVNATVDILKHNIIGKRLFVTVGQEEVVDVLYFNPDNHTIYYTAIPTNDRKERHLYVTSANKMASDFRHPMCITCGVNKDCKYMDAKFPVSGEFYILGCLGPEVPSFSLYSIPDIFVAELEDNEDIRRLVKTKLMPVEEFVTISEEGEPDLQARIIKPSALNKDEIYEYNLVLTTSENIGPQLVTYKFDMGWDYFMSSYHAIIMARVDTRGTRGRGESWAKSMFRKTGKYEVQDILRTMEHFKALHYVKDSVAILGKGYGGYVATAALSSEKNEHITCGAAISPITDFHYMDSFFTEKYHTGWKSTVNGYNNIKLSRSIKQLHNRQFMTLHGTSDDRFHFQHSAQYIKYLISANIDHESKIYPDKSDLLHDIKIKRHVMTDIENFFLKCFGLPRRKQTKAEIPKPDDDATE